MSRLTPLFARYFPALARTQPIVLRARLFKNMVHTSTFTPGSKALLYVSYMDAVNRELRTEAGK